MMINTNTIVSATEANQNLANTIFSNIAKRIDCS